MNIRSKLAAVISLIAIAPAFAQVKINDNLTVTGWAVGSYQYTQLSPGTSSDSANLDAGLLQAIITPAKKTTATVSVYYRPSAEGGVSPSGSEATLLDAYVSYDAGGGLTLSAGKFLSNLGYESFYQISDNMITLANQALLAPIPGYHEGFKLDYSPDKADTMGFQVVDSLYQKPGYNATEGDGEFKHNAGVEAYYTYTGVTNFQFWAGGGYESTTKPGVDTDGVMAKHGTEVSVGDVWATYTVDKAGDQFVLEEIYKDGGIENKGSNWLAYFLYNVPGTKLSSWFCVSGENVDGGASYTKYSVSPTYTYNSNLFVRAQYSYTSYSDYTAKKSNYFGTEFGFKF
jgi:hypothetical protein